MSMMKAIAPAAKGSVLPAISMGQAFSGIGGLLGAAGALSAGNAAASQGNLQAEMLRRDAARIKEIGERDAADFRRKTSGLLATRRAEGGGSGLQQSGTFSDVSANVASEAEYQRLKILSGAADASAKTNAEAILAKTAGQNKKKASRFRAAAMVASAGSQMFGA
jgi:hypothetical protein